jgi:putative PIN family toxin of toxin-antitoxin system
MTTPERVVFDCNVFFQALTSLRGPARRLLAGAASGELSLFISAATIDELADVASRPHLVQKYGLQSDVVAEFIAEIRSFSTFLESIPHVFDFPRDPKDAHYVDLAVAADAKLIVSRDKDLLSLRDATTAEGREFQSRFPGLLVLTPPELLTLLSER